MEERFMILEEMLKDERAEGREEGKIEERINTLFEFLQELGTISDELRCKILKEQDAEVIRTWIKLAAKSTTIEEFMSKIQ